MPTTTEDLKLIEFEDPDLQQIFEILKAASRASSKRQKGVILERLSTEARQLSETLRKEG
jgi:hypothetical protein